MGADSWQHARRPVWGWKVYRQEPDPVQAEALRAAARKLVRGKIGTWDIAMQWTREGPPTVHGGAWHGQVVEAILRRKSNTEGPDPLLKRGLYDAVIKHLDGPNRVPNRPPARKPRVRIRKQREWVRKGRGLYLAPAVITCGTCGSVVSRSGRDRDGQTRFGCKRHSGSRVRPGEYHPRVMGEELEAEITARTVAAWAAERGVALKTTKRRFRGLSLVEKRELAQRYVRGVIRARSYHELGVVEWSTP